MITINIVAQSGYAWREEFASLDDAKLAIPSIVETHGDIDHVELLSDDFLLVENLWTME